MSEGDFDSPAHAGFTLLSTSQSPLPGVHGLPKFAALAPAKSALAGSAAALAIPPVPTVGILNPSLFSVSAGIQRLRHPAKFASIHHPLLYSAQP
jgi:hypothetical protein